jgi:hypothetical protein
MKQQVKARKQDGSAAPVFALAAAAQVTCTLTM